MSKDLIEALLVMIIAMAAGIIHATNIKDSIQCIKDLRESSTRKGGIQVSAIKIFCCIIHIKISSQNPRGNT
jgi:hypothetical protein